MEVKTKMSSRIKILSIAAAVGLVAFCFGCEETGRTVSDSSYNTKPERINVARLHDKAIEIVKESLNDNNNLARTQAIEVVSTTRRTELMPYVTNLLRSNSVPVRFSAAMAVGDTQYYGGEFAVKRLLKDSDENVRIAAAYALTKLGRTGLSDNIRNALESNNQTIRANAALLIGKLGNKNDIELLYSAIKRTDSADKVKLQSVESLAMLGDEGIYRSKLWPLLISKYADDRVFGIQAMGHLRSKKAKDAIATMLRDDIPEIRVVAAGELGKLGDKSGASEVESYMTHLLYRSDAATIADQSRIFVAMAIGQIKDPALTRHLPDLLEDRSANVRLTAAAAVLVLEK